LELQPKYSKGIAMPVSANHSSLTLYEISKEGAFIQDCLIDSEGELSPEIESRLDALMISGSDKLEAAAMVVRNLEVTQEACKAEAKRLSERAKAFEANVDRLKARMVVALDAAFNGKVKTDRFTLWTQKAGDSVSFDLADEYSLEQLQTEHPDFVRVKLELNKLAIQAAYNSEQPLPDSIFIDKKTGERYLRFK
jgi:hypothetical protein